MIDTPNDARLLGVGAAIQSIEESGLASKVVLLPDHKGILTVQHFGELDHSRPRVGGSRPAGRPQLRRLAGRRLTR